MAAHEDRPAVAVVLVIYGDMPSLGDAIDSALASEGVEVDVVVVDNGADEATGAAARQRARVVDAGSNLGFGGGCNLGVGLTSAAFVAFLNADAVLASDALARLAAAASEEEVGIATASVRLRDRPHLMNSAGGMIHFLGLGWADGYLEDADRYGDRDVSAASGAAMVMRREVFDEVGGFTEQLFLYHEDAELSLRVWMRGYRVRFVAAARVLHAYEFGKNANKLYFLERNRLVLVLTCFERRTLLLLAPALVLFEVGMVMLSIAQGWFSEKMAGLRWIASHRRWILDQRRRLQAGRVVGDARIAPLLAERFTGAQVSLPAVLGPADWGLAWYWRKVRAQL
jgi:GT2 family glycosyltransferase